MESEKIKMFKDYLYPKCARCNVDANHDKEGWVWCPKCHNWWSVEEPTDVGYDLEREKVLLEYLDGDLMWVERWALRELMRMREK